MNYYLFKPFFVLPYFDPITPSLKTSTPPPHLKHSPPPITSLSLLEALLPPSSYLPSNAQNLSKTLPEAK